VIVIDSVADAVFCVGGVVLVFLSTTWTTVDRTEASYREWRPGRHG
jgi:hypothetical protein